MTFKERAHRTAAGEVKPSQTIKRLRTGVATPLVLGACSPAMSVAGVVVDHPTFSQSLHSLQRVEGLAIEKLIAPAHRTHRFEIKPHFALVDLK
jgi:hypothetical protein